MPIVIQKSQRPSFKLCDPAQMEPRRALARCALRALGPRLRGRRGLGLSF